VAPLEVPGAAIGRLLVKRDDLTSPAYGGNKVRKLDFLLGKAQASGRRAVVTFGAYGSNHALATAVHARAVGLEPHAILNPQPPTAYARATILAHAGLGTGLHPIDGWEGGDACERLVRELTSRDGVAPLVIPTGGTEALGIVGFVDAALELLGQCEPDVVYVAGGTLGTVVGLAVGFAAAGGRTRVVAPRVTPATVANDAVARRLTSETVMLLRQLDPSFPDLSPERAPFDLRQEFFEPGYAISTPPIASAVALAAEHGLKLETTYTGKAFFALLADAAEGRLEGAEVVFWDTYSSAPMPPPGPAETLPPVLREYVAECDRGFRAPESRA
jgi:1-aminocyclopropane-1-carboxylate deaminase/D-cysteine desulfhydrase-like pyridoxal-dependent ACC family enzyme